MDEPPPKDPKAQLNARLRQLILMRETGPKSRAWHAARTRLIWQLHDELAKAEATPPAEPANGDLAAPKTEGRG